MSWDIKFLPSVGGGGSDPAWYTAMTDQTWTVFTTNTLQDVGGQLDSVASWNDAVGTADSLLICAQGGHDSSGGGSDPSNNAVFEHPFNVATPQWFRRVNASSSAQTDVAYYADGKPTARHGYKHGCYIPVVAGSSNGDRWMAPHIFSSYGSGSGGFEIPASYSRANVAYDAQGFWPNWTRSGYTDNDVRSAYSAFTAYDPVGAKVWFCSGPRCFNRINAYDVATRTVADFDDNPAGAPDGDMVALLDPVRKLFIGLSVASLYIFDINHTSDPMRFYTPPISYGGHGFSYEPVGGKYVQWSSGKTLQIWTPPSNYRTGDGSISNSLNSSADYAGVSITSFTPSTGSTPSTKAVNGTFGRFSYIANPRGFALLNAFDGAMYFFKCATGF